MSEGLIAVLFGLFCMLIGMSLLIAAVVVSCNAGWIHNCYIISQAVLI